MTIVEYWRGRAEQAIMEFMAGRPVTAMCCVQCAEKVLAAKGSLDNPTPAP